MDNILAVREKIQKIVEKCRPLASNLKIPSFIRMFYASNDEFSCDWIDRAKTSDYFKDTTHEETVEKLDGRQFNVCQLRSKFYDDFLELEHQTKVFPE